MELLFIGVACTEEAIKESDIKYHNNKGSVRPQQYFDLNLTLGLSEKCNVTAISEPPVASFPRSKCFFYQRYKDIVSGTLRIKYITLLNLIGIKTLMIMFSVLISTLLFCLKNRRREIAILMGSISSYTSIPVMIVAKIFKVKVFVMVPDVPKYANTYGKISDPLKHLFIQLSVRLSKIIESKFDGYIFLTEQMNEIINFKQKPYIVIEGMINEKKIQYKGTKTKELSRAIMYAGTLHEKFGIKKLVEAFKLSNLENCELWIFGVGDYLKKLHKDLAENNNIKYRGSVSRSEIIRFEREATLLVNPRPSTEEFTKYSFPSKTIEYMASGTPLLTTRLPGIPEEYFNYVFSFDSEDVAGMAAKINRILTMPVEKLNEYGAKARNFIVNNKNHIIQTRKIYYFINKHI